MAGKKGMKHYSVEIKLEAMRLFYEEGLTRAEITQRLGIRDPHRVKAWLKEYRREGAAGFSKPKGRPRKQSESVADELKRLRMENDLLKKLHAELRKEGLVARNIGLSTKTGKDTK